LPRHRSRTITAHLARGGGAGAAAGPQGVLLAMGSRFGGYPLFVRDGRHVGFRCARSVPDPPQAPGS
jgi:hypothetical protein